MTNPNNTPVAPMSDEELAKFDRRIFEHPFYPWPYGLAALRERLRLAEAKLKDMVATEHLRDSIGETSIPYSELVHQLDIMTKSRNHWKDLCNDTAICLADNINQLDATKAKVADLESQLQNAYEWIDDKTSLNLSTKT